MPTTIKVATEFRDRLKAQAAAALCTLGEHLPLSPGSRSAQVDSPRTREAIVAIPPEATESLPAQLDPRPRVDRG